jgi:hypothetical protein
LHFLKALSPHNNAAAADESEQTHHHLERLFSLSHIVFYCLTLIPASSHYHTLLLFPFSKITFIFIRLLGRVMGKH